MVEVLVPIFVCVVLPVAIVWIVSSANKHALDRKTAVMMKAIENGQQVDPEMFKEEKEARSIKGTLLKRVTGGLVCLFIGVALLVSGAFDGRSIHGLFEGKATGGGILIAVGLALLISYFIGKKMLAEEIGKEEQENR